MVDVVEREILICLKIGHLRFEFNQDPSCAVWITEESSWRQHRGLLTAITMFCGGIPTEWIPFGCYGFAFASDDIAQHFRWLIGEHYTEDFNDIPF